MIMNREPYSYQQDKVVPPFSAGSAFTVMDAQCALCARGATWIARNDKAQEFRIIPVQSELGGALMKHYGLNPNDPASWLYVEDGRAYTSLDAFMRVGRRLGGLWKLLSLLRVIPTSFQDRLYRFVAVNRIRYFGRADLCTLPDPEVRKRLVL
jgi:predicted DCC family thiol-disulfide oxidoreductase YuxK